MKKFWKSKWVISLALIILILGFLSYSESSAQSLRIGLLRPPLTLNFFGGTDIWSKRIIGLFYMPLYVHHPKTGEMMPWLAKDLPEVSQDKKQVTVRLKRALWHDGSQVTSEDIYFTVTVIKDFRVPGLMEKWQMVERVIPVDKTTVRFILRYPSAVFFNRSLFCAFVQKKSWAPLIPSEERYGKNLSSMLTSIKPKKIVSNGPFYITKYDEPFYIVLKQNPHFFGTHLEVGGKPLGPYINAVVLKFYKTTEEGLVALKKGKIDFLWWEIPDDRIKELETTKGIKLFRTVRRGFDYLAFNLEKEPFDDMAFRKAIAYVIDRKQLVKVALKGNGVPAISTVPACNNFWYNPKVWRPDESLSHEQRIEKAKGLLSGAGYSWKGERLVLPNGNVLNPITILTTCAGCKPHRFQAGIIIKRWCSDIGIPVKLKMMNIEKILSNLRKGNFQAYILGWSHLPNDPSYLETFFHSKEARKGGKNYPRYRNPLFDRLCEKANLEPDTKRRKKIIFKMQDLIARELPYITLYSKNRIEAVRTKKFSGWMPLPGGIGNLWTFLNLKSN